MWSVWLVFCDCSFQSVCPLMKKDKRLMETSWLREKLGLILMASAMLSKSLPNFLLMDGAVFPPCCLTWGQTKVEVMKIMLTSFKRSLACTATLSVPTLHQATPGGQSTGHGGWPMPPPETPGLSWASLGQSLAGSLLLSPHNSSQIYWKHLFSRGLNKTWSLSSSHLEYPNQLFIKVYV